MTLNNDLAVANTALLRDYAAIDPRLRQLVILIKHWAKRRRVNDAYTGTLSSYAYCLMAIAHLQQRSPPVLPVLQEREPTKRQTIGARRAVGAAGCGCRDAKVCLKRAFGRLGRGSQLPAPSTVCLSLVASNRGAAPRQHHSHPSPSPSPSPSRPPANWVCDYCDDVSALAGFGAANTESLAELLAAFFQYWAAGHDYRSAVVTIRRSAPLTKAEKGWCAAARRGAVSGVEARERAPCRAGASCIHSAQ